MRITTQSIPSKCRCRGRCECNRDALRPLAALDKLVNAFAKEMKKKLKRKALEGYYGWDSPDWTPEQVMESLRAHLDKGDPVDIANFAAFLWNKQP